MIIELPYPPSLNRYYRSVKGRVLISKKGREYRTQAGLQVTLQKCQAKLTGRLKVVIAAYVPDKRRRDLDNTLKCTLDSMQHAMVYIDDEQIDDLRIYRAGFEKGGKLIIEITEL